MLHFVIQHVGTVHQGIPGAFRKPHSSEILFLKDPRIRLGERTLPHLACEERDSHQRRRAGTNRLRKKQRTTSSVLYTCHLPGQNPEKKYKASSRHDLRCGYKLTKILSHGRLAERTLEFHQPLDGYFSASTQSPTKTFKLSTSGTRQRPTPGFEAKKDTDRGEERYWQHSTTKLIDVIESPVPVLQDG